MKPVGGKRKDAALDLRRARKRERKRAKKRMANGKINAIRKIKIPAVIHVQIV